MPCLRWLGKALASALLVVVALAADAAAPRAQDGESAEEVFRDHISGPIVQSRCVICHVQGGLSGHTRLVFVRRSAEVDYETLNLETFRNFLASVDEEGGGGTRILNKVQGVSHGGGVQVPLGSTDFANMGRFLGLLGEEIAFVALTPETLFDTVVLASDRKTLWRAALIFAGRIPTEEEYTAVENGDESALRATIRGLMTGPEFHEFLIRGSNDRLLTDRRVGFIIDDFDLHFVDFTNEAYRRKEAAYASGNDSAFQRWFDTVQFGARRAPLELIAYVAENDLPYTEILTANYIMANPWAAFAYGASASTHFDDPMDPYEFRPSRIVTYYRQGEGFEYEENRLIEGRHVLDPGPLITTYPHAGILNTTSFLNRYPTTATNRNRARARWTYYHFLGLDVEKSASRTTDPVALADTNNPTMHNPACTVCHSVLDPVAGAFQNYSDSGLYKHSWGGLDSLDDLYKEERGPSREIQAESWEERKTLSWRVSLVAGIETLKVMFTNDFYDEDTGDDGMIYLDRLDVREADGQVLASYEFEDLGPPIPPRGSCGAKSYNPATGQHDHLKMWRGYFDCAFFIDVDIPSDGAYDVEIVAWAERYEQYGDGEDDFAKLSVAANAYEEGDTWYRNMRIPGFAGEWTPHPDNSLQWLAEQIVADERFAKATVKFWWPAIMGSEVGEPPEDAADTDFEGRLLAASARDAEVQRLAKGFRDGFPGSPYTYNLKDLLVEIVLSKWFRADGVTDADPVRRVALRDAGARRLLTPEELARKTAAITGVQWGRELGRDRPSYSGRRPNSLTQEYRLLYGGIDSDGITERARDITSVMAGVAKVHAVQVSCPVVLREFYLLPEAERRLFAGLGLDRSELSAVFEIKARSRAERETRLLRGALTAGSKTVRLSFTNDYWEPVTRADRNLRLDRLEVRNAAGQVVANRELESLPAKDYGGPNGDHFNLWSRGSVEVPIEVPASGSYAIEVVVWADQAGPDFPRLSVVVESNAEGLSGEAGAVRSKLVELHDKLLGVQVAPDSPDVEAKYRLFGDVVTRGREAQDDWFEHWQCEYRHDHFYLEGILDGAVIERNFDLNRVYAFYDGIDFSDPRHTAQAWVAVLAALMMDYRYLYL